MLNGTAVNAINSDLSSGAAFGTARVIPANEAISFLGNCKGGAFDLRDEEALQLFEAAGNPNRRPNSDVLRPLLNSRDLLNRGAPRWIIDFADMSLETACLYGAPHRLVVERVKPSRDTNRNDWLRKNWWRPQRMRPNMRAAIERLDRFIVTTTTSKHRVFVWFEPPVLPDHQLVAFARDDDYSFGVLHSRIHELWARRGGTQLRERESGFRYTPTTCFETFPFPEPTDAQRKAIAAAARELDELRRNWLNPPEWTRTEVLEFPGSADGPWKRYLDPASVTPASPTLARRASEGTGVESGADPRSCVGLGSIGTVRYPRIVAKDDDCAKQLKQRTLTKLYNERPTWLDLAHRKLDEAVFAAYGWDAGMGDEELLEKLLALNLERAGARPGS